MKILLFLIALNCSELTASCRQEPVAGALQEYRTMDDCWFWGGVIAEQRAMALGLDDWLQVCVETDGEPVS